MKPYNICFLGNTGYGKSSLINSLFGTAFSTDPIFSCTKELYSVTILNDTVSQYDAITIYDTPGIGEFSSNEPYQRFYDYAVSIADCVVLVVTLARTDSASQKLLLSLRSFLKSEDVKFVIALNHIDSGEIADDPDYVSWDKETNSPTMECLSCVDERVHEIERKFSNKFLPFVVVPVCAVANYGTEKLKKAILTI